jgi:hypothetical protein
MKSLKFRSIELLSERERKGRRLEFHLSKNLILGMNHVGKSALTKQIFEAFGAKPVGALEGWDDATIAWVTLLIDGADFHLLRQHQHRALFDSEGNLLYVSSKLGEWTKLFSTFLDFNLVLSDKHEESIQADAACMFLPFYINQDGGWSGKWLTFEGLGRYKDATKSVVEYFTQILPPKYYLAKSEAEAEAREIRAIEADLRILNRARTRFLKSIEIVGPQLSAEGFELEIKEVSRQLTELNAQQEVYRLEAVGLNEDLASVDHQIALTTETLTRFEQDFDFLAKPRQEDLVCPTCGAQHEESFLSVLTFAEDGRSLSEMLIQLQATRNRLAARLLECTEQRRSLANTYQELQTLLEVKRGEIQFQDVVKSMGSDMALRTFDNEDRDLSESLEKHLTKKYRLEQDMKALKSPKRRKEIRDFFLERYRDARVRLNLMSKDMKKVQVTTRPNVSGSGGPREVLAYYAALWWTSEEDRFNSPFFLPIVVDCPAQSGQDAINLPAILHFLSVGLPPHAQVFVTHEGDVQEQFDRRIELMEARSLLSADEFESVSINVLPKLEQMQQALLRQT